MGIDNFYERSVLLQKSLKLIDTNGDGVRDTFAVLPDSNSFFLQVGLNQSYDDIGIYTVDDSQQFEIIDLSSFWDTTNDGSNDGYVDGFTGLTDNFSGTTGTGSLDNIVGCMDQNSPYYNPFATIPCTNNCCDTGEGFGGTTAGGFASSASEIECLALYTDWGPWNDNLLLNDTYQYYRVTQSCTYTVRMINQYHLQAFPQKPGGWYGAKLSIEIDGQPLNVAGTSSVEDDITFNTSDNTWTLDDVVRVHRGTLTVGTTPKSVSTKPYRDITFTVTPGSLVKITFIEPGFNTNYNSYKNYLRYQFFRGEPVSPDPTGACGTDGTCSIPTWNTTSYGSFAGLEMYEVSSNDGTTFGLWENYLDAVNTNTFDGTSVSNLSYYTNTVNLLDNGNNSGLSTANVVPNPNTVYEQSPPCTVGNNYVSYFDRNGDGFVEQDTSYPTTANGSVDVGLFSTTRYDSPYVFLKPGTKDGINSLTNNQLTNPFTLPIGSMGPTTTPSSAGWRYYGYPISTFGGNFNYKTVSPTCQLSGCDVQYNSVTELTDDSNSNIFLPQVDSNVPTTNCATYGNGNEVVLHWNTSLFDAKGQCCARWGTFETSTNGPWPDVECSTCHMEMTPRSAQPVLSSSVQTLMQTPGSNIYYGPFYDPTNPTYNGYGLAYSKAHSFCRDVRNKIGVRTGTTILDYQESKVVDENLKMMGGIIHGAASHTTVTTSISNRYGVNFSPNNWTMAGTNTTSSACSGSKLPLKCKKVVGDPNCPNGTTCVKCLYCFFCSQIDLSN